MRPWGHFCGTMQVAQSPWSCNELSSDCAAWPQKGRHGYDNGDWIRLHRHQWIPTDGQVVDAWKNYLKVSDMLTTSLQIQRI